ncbi:AmmeMemoRadiSam system protein B [Petrotoga sp. 9PWA.NaAc.5.4]|uniref:AmmeMemoRadiSam system protein B n=1 Tax=Petrotoga sp. 9PWA.NaAc.5.4 TaxID=1434328 RepID=UPI000CA9690A|nr:AmmeMemoRadiSam system protein B [Petrotoga sp. 9PWA.NaAc.5.4]PNR96712.1 hypothetical protein X924_02200 [Petrotoga sp. 9PWA.NaAc.5.4]
MKRKAVVAGTFYPSNPQKLKNTLKNFYGENFSPDTNHIISPMGIITPHAGYIYSGETAVKAYKRVFEQGIAKRVILIGPNHTGLGSPISLFEEGSWETPLGTIDVDDKACQKIIKDLNLSNDPFAHFKEHSLEVQLPFLQFVLSNNFKIVPICLMDQRLETAKKIAYVIRNLLKEGDLVIASTDMNHYENHLTTIEKDNKVIQAIQNMDVEAMYDTIKRYNITMCGFGAVAALLNIGFKKVEIIDHTTSGDKSGDYNAVVGYLSAVFEGF